MQEKLENPFSLLRNFLQAIWLYFFKNDFILASILQVELHYFCFAFSEKRENFFSRGMKANTMAKNELLYPKNVGA